MNELADIEPHLITLNEAVAGYSVSKRTLWNWIDAGRLQRYKRYGDRLIRVDRRQVERLRQWRQEQP